MNDLIARLEAAWGYTLMAQTPIAAMVLGMHPYGHSVRTWFFICLLSSLLFASGLERVLKARAAGEENGE